MLIDYDAFRLKSWDERLTLFNELSANEKSALVRTHIARWLEEHRAGRTNEQIEIVEECIAVVTPALYERPGNDDLPTRAEEVMDRAAACLTPAQMRAALTMHWPDPPDETS